MSAPVTLPQIAYEAPDFDARFMASLHEYGFAAVVTHPLEGARISRISSASRAFIASGEGAVFEMDTVKQDGYFSLRQAEHAKGFLERDHKEYFQVYPWGRCPES